MKKMILSMLILGLLVPRISHARSEGDHSLDTILPGQQFRFDNLKLDEISTDAELKGPRASFPGSASVGGTCPIILVNGGNSPTIIENRSVWTVTENNVRDIPVGLWTKSAYRFITLESEGKTLKIKCEHRDTLIHHTPFVKDGNSSREELFSQYRMLPVRSQVTGSEVQRSTVGSRKGIN